MKISNKQCTIDFNAPDLYFMTMAVSPTFAGRGVGKKLLKKLEEEAGKKNCISISLDTYEPLTNAIKLYKSYGYSRLA